MHLFVRGGQLFLPSGMLKTTPTVIVSTSVAKVTGWVVDGAYPGSSISSDGLVANGGKSGATVAASCVVSNGSAGSRSVTLSLRLNGSVIATGSAQAVGAFSSATAGVSTSTTVANGDVLELWAIGTGTLTIASDAASYVRIT
ncbi:hypothetical protein ACHIPZ_25010 [Antrihabitans sp. NCIMB 15449]|uniref:Uncharacterized protein n=1 Tax=Antrihabitans spumae TaxID=3373370 RepID=A0ABW7JTU6_9NOCA